MSDAATLHRLCGVPQESVHSHGLFSPEIALATAQAIRTTGWAGVGLAVLGGRREGERTWAAIASRDETRQREIPFSSGTEISQVWLSTLALDWLRRVLLGIPDSG